MFGRRIFGKQQHSFAELKKRMRPTPDADGVTCVFSKELWDDPKIGSMLRELGFAPDDQRNIMRTADDYIALFATAKYRLQKRSETFNRDMAARHGYCRAAPFLVIDQSIWDGEHGAFLYAQMDLIGFDDGMSSCWRWMRGPRNCAACRRIRAQPALTQLMTEHVIRWKTRYEFALEEFGVTATGGQGITREQFEAQKEALRKEIIDTVASMKPRTIGEL